MTRVRKSNGRRLEDKGQKLAPRSVLHRELRQRFLIICEGEKTEPNYFRSFRVNVDVEVVGTACNTLGLLECARARQKEARRQGVVYDAIWLVFDRDDFSAQDFNSAIRLAEMENFGVAYSNEAFELWYVLHFGYLDTAISRKQYIDILCKHLEVYNKNQMGMYERLLPFQTDAIRNADKLLQSYQPNHNPAEDNPCTTVHKLVMELNKHLT